jgi:hypothetical protein
VHSNMSAYIALADTTAGWQLGSAQCLSGSDIIGYDFLSITKDGIMPVFVQSASEARLGEVIFQ